MVCVEQANDAAGDTARWQQQPQSPTGASSNPMRPIPYRYEFLNTPAKLCIALRAITITHLFPSPRTPRDPFPHQHDGVRTNTAPHPNPVAI